ncbi:hypothetical protein SCARD494_12798 [Seiridium cardinale]
MVQMLNASAWKKHLFVDLQPYLCPYDGCNHNSSPFQTKVEWTSHLLVDHIGGRQTKFDCPLCKQGIVGDSMPIVKHLSQHLEEIALTALPNNDDPDENNDEESTIWHQATTAHEMLHHGKTESMEQSLSPRSSPISHPQSPSSEITGGWPTVYNAAPTTEESFQDETKEVTAVPYIPNHHPSIFIDKGTIRKAQAYHEAYRPSAADIFPHLLS